MDIRPIINIAIIAHVDHGKTTLVDKLLEGCASLDEKEKGERVMDSNDIERERGITILSKNTAVDYQGHKINIIDTPGHSDFGGEVERVLKMVNSTLLIVDAMEGPMPQTRFVLKKSLELGHKVMVVINKIDRPFAEPQRAVNEVFDLFSELGATDEQLDFPIVYASAKLGYAGHDDSVDFDNLAPEKLTILPLLDEVIKFLPKATTDNEAPFQFQVSTLGYDNYLGRICIGRVFQGTLKVGETLNLIGVDENGKQVITKHKITKLFTFLGLKRVETPQVVGGDIAAVAGIPEMTIGDTLCNAELDVAIPRIAIEPPTVEMTFTINDSPLAGKEGKYVTSRNIRDRLEREIKGNIALKYVDKGDSFIVAGRGELQLAILIENMRREGFELGVSKPEVIFKSGEGGRQEPYEQVVLDLPQDYSGSVIQELNRRKGVMLEMNNLSETMCRVIYEIPTRGIIGFRSFLLTETRGEGTMAGRFLDYRPFAGKITGRTRGAIVSMETGQTNAYGLYNTQDRGDLFIGVQTEVYVGMILGLSAKEGDMDVNPVKEKKLTNVRSSGTDEALRLTPHRQMTLEECLDFLEADELLEVSPVSLRLRKKVLDPVARKRAAKSAG